jgi:hypothetical protein
MKRFLPGIGLLAIFGFVFTQNVLAQDSNLKVINGDVFRSGKNVEITGVVNGDVYAFGERVFISGVVNGDVIAAGSVVIISGRVSEDVRAAGGRVEISADIGNDLTAAGGEVHVSGDSTIFDGAMLAGQTVALSGSAGYAKLAGENISVNGNVNGDLVYWSGNEAQFGEDANVAGATTRNEGHKVEKKDQQEASKAWMIGSTVVGIVTSLISGLIILWLLPQLTKKGGLILARNPLRAFGWGIIFNIAMVFITLVLVMTLIGIPLAIISTIVWILYMYLSRVFVFVAIGMKVSEMLNTKSRLGAQMIFGLLVYYVLTLIPVIGGITKFVTAFAGAGAGVMLWKQKAH